VVLAVVDFALKLPDAGVVPSTTPPPLMAVVAADPETSGTASFSHFA
jgi:hypothetical protein